MKRRRRRHTTGQNRRTTLTLPADSLTEAERIARARNVNLSTIVSEALVDGLRMQVARERPEQVLNAYKKAFAALSDEELLILDGIVPESRKRRR
jgi:hypothetical protein